MRAEIKNRIRAVIIKDTTPEPAPVVVSLDCCATHSFNFISVPRNLGDPQGRFSFKCCIKSCQEGVE